MAGDIEIRARGINRTIRRLTSKATFFTARSQAHMQRLGEEGIRELKDAVRETGIRTRTGALLESIKIKEVSPMHVVFGFSGDREAVAMALDQGATYPPMEAAPGRVFALEKGPGEGVVFRRSIGERTIKARHFMSLTTERIIAALGGKFTAGIRREMRRKE